MKIAESQVPNPLIGRMPWVHAIRPPHRGIRARVDDGLDTFWFALTFLIWVITPVLGVFWIIAGRVR